ncbi:hypothetical protein V8G54_037882 (chloroplast) [Vigna mungo]|uniref:1,4-alpha-D-glucan glucanohydrolase n=1 Tax=Vigna mungo TaxID=3915 RepID=A0AAQ3MDY1_VIGMU
MEKRRYSRRQVMAACDDGENGGRKGIFDGIPLAWDEHAVTTCSGGLGNPSTGKKTFPGFPNIDHTKEYVRKNILNCLRWLRYDVDSHRQDIINWIDGMGQLSTAFDFTTKGILQETAKGEFWRLRDAKGKALGVMGWWASRSITFLDNHDTGSSQLQFIGIT